MHNNISDGNIMRRFPFASTCSSAVFGRVFTPAAAPNPTVLARVANQELLPVVPQAVYDEMVRVQVRNNARVVTQDLRGFVTHPAEEIMTVQRQATALLNDVCRQNTLRAVAQAAEADYAAAGAAVLPRTEQVPIIFEAQLPGTNNNTAHAAAPLFRNEDDALLLAFKKMIEKKTEEFRQKYTKFDKNTFVNWIGVLSLVCALKSIQNDFTAYQTNLEKHKKENAERKYVIHQAHHQAFLTSLCSLLGGLSTSGVPGAPLIPAFINLTGEYTQHGHAKIAAISALLNLDPTNISSVIAEKIPFLQVVKMSSTILTEGHTVFAEFEAAREDVIGLYEDLKHKTHTVTSPQEMQLLEREVNAKIQTIKEHLQGCVLQLDEHLSAAEKLHDPLLDIPEEIRTTLRDYRQIVVEFIQEKGQPTPPDQVRVSVATAAGCFFTTCALKQTKNPSLVVELHPTDFFTY